MNVTWFVIRSSGLVAFSLLTLSTLWGLLLSTGVLGRAASSKALTLFHETTSVAALVATLAHMVGLYLDEYVAFDPASILVPGWASWRPLAVAFGITSFYGMLLLTVSFYVRGRIGQRQWRILHFGSFGVFVAAMLHGILAGTDRAHPAVFALYVTSAALFLALVAVRITMSLRQSPQRAGSSSSDLPAPTVAGGPVDDEIAAKRAAARERRQAMLLAARSAAESSAVAESE